MTIEVLLHSPTQTGFQTQLKEFLVQKPGRIFIVTGNFSKRGTNTALDFLEILIWAASGKDRHLDVLVGVFEDNCSPQTQRVVDTLASLINQAHIEFKKMHPHTPMAIPVRFHAVEKWHAKAIGFTGLGTRFMDAEKIMFGSTNFSESALHGDNFEIDIYADNSSNAGMTLLTMYMQKLKELIIEGKKNCQIPEFHDLVMKALKGKIEVTDTGMTWE